MAGIILLLFINVASLAKLAANSLIFCIHTLSLFPIKPLGPHILPEFLNKPVRIYKPNFDRNLIGIENRNRTIIYQ